MHGNKAKPICTAIRPSSKNLEIILHRTQKFDLKSDFNILVMLSFLSQGFEILHGWSRLKLEC